MEARKLIRDAAFDPSQLEIITAAFDGAWQALEGRFASESERKLARLKLATIILARASAGMLEPEHLKASAIQAMNELLD